MPAVHSAPKYALNDGVIDAATAVLGGNLLSGVDAVGEVALHVDRESLVETMIALRDTLLHFAVIRLRDSQLFAGHEGRFGGDEIFGLRVDLAHAGFAKVLAVGVVLRAIHFRVAALLAEFLQGLPAHAQVIFHLRNAGARGIPFLFEFALANFQPEFFAAQAFELQR